MKDTTLVMVILALFPIVIIGSIILFAVEKPSTFDKWCIENGGTIPQEPANTDCAVWHENCLKNCEFNGSIYVNYYDTWRVPNVSSHS